MRKYFLLIFVAILLLSAGTLFPARAAVISSAPWQISAERMESSADGRVVTARGAVEMHPADSSATSIKADEIVYDRGRGVVDAMGRVEFHSESDRIKAARARINLNTEAVLLKNGRLYYYPRHLYISGTEISRDDPVNWHFRHLVLSTCDFDEERAPDWSFAASRGRVTVDGYAFLHNVTFRVGRVPLFYLPWLVFPAKTTRQSGFLFPQISSSGRDGFALVTPFFVNLSPSFDLTLSPGYYAKRGPSLGLEARYRMASDSAGLLAASVLKDRTEDRGVGSDDDYRSDGWLRDRHDRYWLRGKVDQGLGERTWLDLDFDLASDPDFILEYRDALDGFRQGQSQALVMFHRGYQEPGLVRRENVFSLSHDRANGFIGAQAVMVDDLKEESSPGAAVNTLPRLAADLRLPLYRLPATLSLTGGYLNYYPRQGQGYQRFDLSPTLVAGLPVGLLEGKVSLGTVNRIYRVEGHGDAAAGDSTEESRAAVVRANIASTWERDFFSRRLQHSLRPNLVYTFIDPGPQDGLPLIDGDERDDFVNRLSWELNNYFRSRRQTENGGVEERLAARLKLSQPYDIHEARQSDAAGAPRRPFGDLALDLEIYPSQAIYFRYQSALSMYGDHVTRSAVEGRYSRNDNSASLNYTYTRGGGRDLTAALKVQPFRRLGFSYEVSRSLLTDHLVREAVSVTYTPGCWGLTLEAAQDSEDRKVSLLVTLTGLGRGLRLVGN